jgi:hypothetical protein
MFEIRAEGLTVDELRFEIARRYVRLAGVSAVNAAKKSSRSLAVTVAKKAIKDAARIYAPG